MKKITSIIITLILMFALASCGPRVNVKGYFLNVEEKTTSITFTLEIEDPNDQITGNVIVEVIDLRSNTIVDTKTLLDLNQYTDISFSGLDNQGDYRIDVRVMIGRESKVIITHDVELLSLETVIISTVEEFMSMADNPEGNYELAQDIDFSGIDFVSPFSSVTKTFSGTFDGKGFSLSNISFSSIVGNVGIFGYVSSGTIENLKIQHVNLGTSTEPLIAQYATKIGVLAGYVSSSDAVIDQITISDAEIHVTSSSTYQLYVGGAFGDLRSVAKNITQDNVEIHVLTTSYAKVNVGGIAGFVGEEGGLRQILSQANIYQEVEGNYIDISTKAWNINVGGVVGDFNSRLSRGFQNVIHSGDIQVNLDYNTPSGQTGTYDLYIGGLTGRTYGQIYQAIYHGSIDVNHVGNEFESSITKTFYIGGISGHYESNYLIDHAIYNSSLQNINVNVSDDVKLHLSYTIGINPIVLNHDMGYFGNGGLYINGNLYEETKPSITINDIDNYFTTDFMKEQLN